MIAGGVAITCISSHDQLPGKPNQVGSDEHSATLGRRFYGVLKNGDRLSLNSGNIVSVGRNATRVCGRLESTGPLKQG